MIDWPQEVATHGHITHGKTIYLWLRHKRERSAVWWQSLLHRSPRQEAKQVALNLCNKTGLGLHRHLRDLTASSKKPAEEGKKTCT